MFLNSSFNYCVILQKILWTRKMQLLQPFLIFSAKNSEKIPQKLQNQIFYFENYRDYLSKNILWTGRNFLYQLQRNLSIKRQKNFTKTKCALKQKETQDIFSNKNLNNCPSGHVECCFDNVAEIFKTKTQCWFVQNLN